MENIPANLFVAIGTVSAALITAVIAIISLILSKEIKVSELRQNWIDSLREEIAKVISLSTELSTIWRFTEEKNQKTYVQAVIEHSSKIEEINKNLSLVELRLNPDEHAKLLKLIKDFEKLISDFNEFEDPDKFHGEIDRIVVESKVVLKKEWLVVKEGGKTFKTIKENSKLTIVLSIFALIILLIILKN